MEEYNGCSYYCDKITETKKLENEISNQRNFLNLLLDTIPDYVFYKDRNSVYLGCNYAFANKFIGLNKEDIEGKTDYDIIKDKNLAEFFIKKDRETIDKKQINIIEQKIPLSDGSEVDFETVKTPFYDENGNVLGVICVGRDITRHKKYEEELIKAKTLAEAANLAKNQFLANVTHELKTPMNGIMGMLQLALLNDIDDETKECLEIAQKSAHSLLQIINDILDYSKIEVGKMSLLKNEFNLELIIDEIVKLVSFDLNQKKLKLNMYFDSSIPKILYGDSVRLRQVLMNLINNAIKFTESGHIDLKIESIEKNDNFCTLEFKVIDTGIGIPKDKIQLLFKPFNQIDNSNTKRYQGTGLGLAISKKFIDMMDGDIYVESEEGKGSIFGFKVSFKLEGI